MLMPKALQAKLPRIFGEPDDDAATGESIWGMITKSEEGLELAPRPAVVENTPEASGVDPGPPEPVVVEPLTSPPAGAAIDLSSDRLLSSMNQIPPSKDRSVPRRAGTPFPLRPKGEKPVRPPKVTIQTSSLPVEATKKGLFETPLILEAKDVAPPADTLATDLGSVTALSPESGPAEPPWLEPSPPEPPSIFTSAPALPADPSPAPKLSPLWTSVSASTPAPVILTRAEPPAPPAVEEETPPPVSIKTNRRSGTAPKIAPSALAEAADVAPDPTLELKDDPVVKTSRPPLDWDLPAEPSATADALFPASRPITFSSSDGPSMAADHDLLHTPFVIRRSRRRKALPLLLIAGGAVAFVLLNGVALYYMPKLLGERTSTPPMKGFISGPSVMASNAPAMQPVVAPTAPASRPTVDQTATASAPVAQLKPLQPAPTVAPAPVAPAPAVQPEPEIRQATNRVKPATTLKPSLPAPTQIPQAVAHASAAAAKPAPAKPVAVASATPPTVKTQTPSKAAAVSPAVETSPVTGQAPTAADGVLVQIGAFASTDVADKGWRAVTAAMPSDMVGKSRRVQPVAKDGSTLYRTMIAGFSDRDKATAFCAGLKEKGLACFVRP